MAKQTENNVGIYLRLSQEDMREGDSLSIDNQKLILTKFVQEKGWNLVDEYIDDGYTGTDFSRPGVQRLLGDAQTGRINIIVVKDLSRFGRNYIEVGRYLDYIFPMNNIRFIALNDGVDTADRNSAALEMMPIVNLFNEWHSSSTSKKIRAVFLANAKAGNYMGSIAPYGYVRSETPNHTLVIDPEAAEIVRRIFEMRAIGMPYNSIAKVMNAEGVLTPSEYRYHKLGRENPRFTLKVWDSCVVKTLIQNPVYTGVLAQMKRTTVSHKNHKEIKKDPSEWVIAEDTHEPIVPRELWDKCAELGQAVSRGKTCSNGVMNPLSGFCYCADCGNKMKKNGHTNKKAYICGLYARAGKGYCSSHHIPLATIEEIVLRDIRSKISLTVDEEKAKQIFLAHKKGKQAKQNAADTKRLRAAERRLTELDRLIHATYEDKVMGRVPEEMCISLLNDYQQEKEKLTSELDMLRQSIEADKQDSSDIDEFIRRLRSFENAEVLTREMCNELIEYVKVDSYVSPTAPRDIYIHYKLLDEPMNDSNNLYK